jgi:hypothetical protein
LLPNQQHQAPLPHPLFLVCFLQSCSDTRIVP